MTVIAHRGQMGRYGSILILGSFMWNGIELLEGRLY